MLWERGVVVGGTTGIGAPGGLVGLLAQIDLAPQVGVSWAMGRGGLGGAAAFGGWWRPVLPGDEWAPVLGASFSVNVIPAGERAMTDRQLPSTARWLNLEVGSEWRVLSGRLIRLGLGHAFLVNGSSFRCREGVEGFCQAASESNVPGWAPYGGGAVRTGDLLVSGARGQLVHLWFLHLDVGAIFPFLSGSSGGDGSGFHRAPALRWPDMALSPSLLTDRYQLTMLAAYARSGHARRRAVFELFVRRLPPSRRYLVACGVGRVVEYLQQIRFSSDELAYLEADPVLGPALRDPRVRELFEGLRFQARVTAIPEGRICFPFEPLIQVEGTLAEAQLVETLLLSVVNHDARVASKCARIVEGARGRECFEFGSRRTHEVAAVHAARSAYVAGFAATSNEEAARLYGVPVRGTMAHAYVLTHAADHGEEGEIEAFRSFADAFGGAAVCLVDTFDTLRGVDRAIEALGSGLSGIRLDSGDLASLAAASRRRLDAAGLERARIVLSDDLDEYKIRSLLDQGVPVDAFGVGTMAVSTPDAPSLGAVYKLVALEDDQGRLRAVEKRASGKGSTAGPKQVFRRPGTLDHTVALRGEPSEGEALLTLVFEGGKPVGDRSLAAARSRLLEDLALAPARLRSLEPRGEEEGFPSRRTERLWQLHQQVERKGNAPLDGDGFS